MGWKCPFEREISMYKGNLCLKGCLPLPARKRRMALNLSQETSISGKDLDSNLHNNLPLVRIGFLGNSL